MSNAHLHKIQDDLITAELSRANTLSIENEALRAENARLKEALQGMLKLVDADVLVRNTANDHAVGWSTQTVLIVHAVQQANEALQPERGKK